MGEPADGGQNSLDLVDLSDIFLRFARRAYKLQCGSEVFLDKQVPKTIEWVGHQVVASQLTGPISGVVRDTKVRKAYGMVFFLLSLRHMAHTVSLGHQNSVIEIEMYQVLFAGIRTIQREPMVADLLTTSINIMFMIKTYVQLCSICLLWSMQGVPGQHLNKQAQQVTSDLHHIVFLVSFSFMLSASS